MVIAGRERGAGLETRALASAGEAGEASWRRLFPDGAALREYYLACEAAPPEGFRLGATGLFDGGRIVALAPTFRIDYRLDLSLPERLRAVTGWLARIAPRLVRLPVIGLGSPLSERCHIGIDPGLPPAARGELMGALLAGLMTQARASRADIVALKDIADADLDWCGPALDAAGFARVATLPIAVLDLPQGTLDDYLAGLSPKMRQDLRRKLRQSSAVRVEFIERIEGREAEIATLYEETRRNGHVDYGDFDEIAPGYFAAVMRAMPGRARMALYWLGSELIGFNLFLVESDRVVGKFIGMRYPVAREQNLYFVNWIAMVRFCLENGKRTLVAGTTTYALKARLGALLERSWIGFRHRNPVVNVAFRAIGPRFPFDQMDPDLKALGATAPYRVPGPGRPMPPASS
jgi:hypothetical protein